MDGVEKCALLLLGVGEEQAANVLKYLEPKEVQKVGLAMTSLANVNKNQIKTVVSEFISEAEQQTSLGVNSEEYIRKMLISALGQDRASSFIDQILSNADKNGLEALRWLDPKSVFEVIKHEHPQITVAILTYLDSEQAAQVISHFPEENRVDLLLRMSAIDSIKPEALFELGNILQSQLSGQKKIGKTASIGGVKSAADIINYLDSSIETQVLEGVKGVDEKLCDQIKEQMFIFENLVDVDGRSIQALLREVSSETLLLALKGSNDQVKEKIFSNMSKRAAELMKDDLETKGPVKLSEVEVAQKEILATARRLADSGEIILGGKGSEEMV